MAQAPRSLSVGLSPPPVCSSCGTEIGPNRLSCPQCHRLIHSDQLARLAKEVEEAIQREDWPQALQTWRQALELLPPGSRQYRLISEKCGDLSRRLDQQGKGVAAAVAPASAGDEPWTKKWGEHGAALGAAGFFLWKFKFVFGFLLTKGKFLLLGLTKSSTFFSMLLAASVYWTVWGWKFAFGIVGSIYVHEMGHVAALQRYGIKASAPMFVPGFGAFIRLKQYPSSAREDARVGLAGPIWGLGAAAAAYGIHLVTGAGSWAAIAKFGAWINLFNLMPVWQLDGSRGFRAMTKQQRWFAVAALGAAWFLTGDGLLFLVGLVAVARALGEGAEKPDQVALAQYVFLVAALAALSSVGVPGVDE